MVYKKDFYRATGLSSRMLKQLIEDWKAQATYGQGTRSYVFSVCASELQEVLESIEGSNIKHKGLSVGNEIDSSTQINAKF